MTPERYMAIRALADKLIASHGGDMMELIDQVHELELDECRLLDTMALECCDCNHWFGTDEIGLDDETGEYKCHDCGGSDDE